MDLNNVQFIIKLLIHSKYFIEVSAWITVTIQIAVITDRNVIEKGNEVTV